MTSARLGPGHVAELLALDARVDHLGDRARDGDTGRQQDVVGREVDREEQDGGEKIGAQSGEYVLHRLALC